MKLSFYIRMKWLNTRMSFILHWIRNTPSTYHVVISNRSVHQLKSMVVMDSLTKLEECEECRFLDLFIFVPMTTYLKTRTLFCVITRNILTLIPWQKTWRKKEIRENNICKLITWGIYKTPQIWTVFLTA